MEKEKGGNSGSINSESRTTLPKVYSKSILRKLKSQNFQKFKKLVNKSKPHVFQIVNV